MVKSVILTCFLSIFLISGCDSNELITPEGPHEFRVDLQYNFADDLVVIELDGYRVYRERVTTLDVLSLADMVEFDLPDGEHEMQVVVNGKSSASTSFAAGQYPVLAVTYNRFEDSVSLSLLEEPPLYD